MPTGPLPTDPAVRQLIAAGLTQQEWLADRRSTTTRWLGRAPGSAWLLTQLLTLLRPRLLRAACRRVRCDDAHALVLQLLTQGNRLEHLFGWTPAQLSVQRLQQESEGVQWLLYNSLQQGPANADELALLLAARLQHSLEPEAGLLFESVKESVIEAAQKRLHPMAAAQARSPREALALARAAHDLHACIQRLCRRLAHDQRSIQQTLGLDLASDRPTKLEMGCGDTHRDGDSTTLITLSSGNRLLYKPRDMALEQALSELIEPGAIPKILPRQGYGYQQHVDAGPPELAVGGQLGRLIAQLDVLGAVDLHQDNLIIGVQQMWLVDGETVLHRRVTRPHKRALVLPPLGDSVLALGVVTPPVKAKLAGSSFWRLDHGLSRLAQPRGLPCDGAETNTLVPLNPLEQELLVAYGEQLRHADGAGGLPWRLLKTLKGLRRRVVMRNTCLYGALLRSMRRRPKRRQAETALDGLWDLFRGNPKHALLVDLATAEALELARGHIPLFTTRIGAARLDPIDGISIPAHQHRTVLHEVRRRQRQRASRADQQWQCTLLRAALLLFRAPELNQRVAVPGCVVQATAMIQEHLDQTALNWCGEHLWLTLENSNSTRPWYCLSRDLYRGTQGIHLALRWLNAKRPLPRFTPPNWTRPETLSAAALAQINGDLLAWSLQSYEAQSLPRPWRSALQRIHNNLAQHLSESSRSADLDQPSCDLISGLGGLIGVLGAVRRSCGAKETTILLQVQIRSAQLLLNLQRSDGSWPDPDPQTPGLTGWSHGTAGIAAALGAIRNDAPVPMTHPIRLAITRAIAHELNWLDNHGDWLDRRTARGERDQPSAIGQSWCHGAPGALLAAVALHRHGFAEIPNFDRWLKQALAATLRARPCVDGLCCGTSGLLLIQELAAEAFGAPELSRRAGELRKSLAEKVCNRRVTLGDYFPLRYHPPGLFDGYSGIALALGCSGTDPHVQTLLSYGLVPPIKLSPQPATPDRPGSSR